MRKIIRQLIKEMALEDFRYIDSENPEDEDKAHAMKTLNSKIHLYREKFERWFKTNRQVFGDANVYVFPTIQDEEFVLKKIGKSISDSHSPFEWARSRYFDLDEEIIRNLGISGPVNLESDVIFIPIIDRGVKRGYLPGIQLFTPWMMFHAIADDVEEDGVPWLNDDQKQAKFDAGEAISSLTKTVVRDEKELYDEEELEKIGETGFFRTQRSERKASKDPNYVSDYIVSSEGINELFVDALLRPLRGPRLNSTENFHGDKKEFVRSIVVDHANSFRTYCRGKLITVVV